MPTSSAFNKMYESVKKTYLHKDVPVKFKAKYGKKYQAKEIKLVAYAIAKSRGIPVEK